MTEAARLEVVLDDNFSKAGDKIAGVAQKVDRRARAMGDALDHAGESASETAKRMGWVVTEQGRFRDRSGRFVSAARRQAEGLAAVGDKALSTGRRFDRLEGQMKALVRASTLTSRAVRGLGVSFAAVVGVAVLRDITQAGFGMAKLAGNVSTLRTSFVSLSKGAGVDPRRILNQIGRGANDTLSEIQALTLANTALATGVRPLIDNLGDVVGNVRSLSQALGRDATEDISRFVGAIQKQERELLDDLTIVVGADQAYKAFAKSVGKSTSALTSTERQTAFANEALRQLKTRVKELGPTTNEFADSIARASASFTNLKTTLGFLTAPAFTEAAKNLTEFFGKPAAQQGVAALVGGLGALGVAGVKVVTGFGEILAQAGNFGPLADKLRGFADSQIASWAGLSDVLKDVADQLEKLKFVAPGDLSSGLPGTPVAKETKTEAPKPFNYAKLVRAIDDVGTAFGGLEPRIGRATQTIVGFAANIQTNPFGAFTIAASGMIDLFGGRGLSAQEKYRNKLAETSQALNAAADALANFGDVAQDLSRQDLGGRVSAFKQLESFGVQGDRDLKKLFGDFSFAGGDLAFKAIADDLGLGVKELLRSLNDIEQQFPNVKFGSAGSFDAVAGIANQAAAQLQRFGEFDRGTFAGATGDFSFQRSIARPGADLRKLFEDSFGQLVSSFNTEDLTFTLKEGVSISSSQTRTLKELLAELRDFHDDATQDNAIVERLVRERFRGEELAVRARFAGRFSAAGNDPIETNRLLREMTRELSALAFEEKSFARAVASGQLGEGLGTGLSGAGGGAAATGSTSSGSGEGWARALGLDGAQPLSVPINDVIEITGQVSFLRWDQAVSFDGAQPLRASWTDTVLFEQASALKHVPPDGFASLADIGPTTPPITFPWPDIVVFEADEGGRHRPATWGDLAVIDGSVGRIPATWDGVVDITADPGRRHVLSAWQDAATIADDAARLVRAWSQAVELRGYNRLEPGAWGNIATIPETTAHLVRAWSQAVELRGYNRLEPGVWGNIATIPETTARLARSWSAVVEFFGNARAKPGAWTQIVEIPADTARIGRGWPSVVSMLPATSARHRPASWGALVALESDLAKFLYGWPDIVNMVAALNRRHRPDTWATFVDFPVDLARFGRGWPGIVEMRDQPTARHRPQTWGRLVDIPIDSTTKFNRMWPTTVNMMPDPGGRHRPATWAVLADLPLDLARFGRGWPGIVQMRPQPAGRHEPGTWSDLVHIPATLSRLEMEPVDFIDIVGEPVEVDVNQLWRPVGQLRLPPEAVTGGNPPAAGGPPGYDDSPLSPFEYNAADGGGDFFSRQWGQYAVGG